MTTKERLTAAILVSVCAVAATATADSRAVLGTVRASGATWVSATGSDWDRLERTRPLVAGDRLRTAAGGFALADLGQAGSLALAPESRIVVERGEGGAIANLEQGLVAFSAMRVGGLTISVAESHLSTAAPVSRGTLVTDGRLALLRVDEGAMAVSTSGGTARVEAGGQLLLAASVSAATAAAAEASGDGATDRLASWARSRLGGLNWSSVALLAAVAGGVVATSDDDAASPSQ